jgi:hypothetical protein
MLPPPHNGIGTEEDSLGSFLYLMPKVPKQDFKKLMENDGIQLRYLAKFVDPQIEDKDRRFIITFYLNNDSVSVFEKFERNSGFIGGKFFERARAKNPEVCTAPHRNGTANHCTGTARGRPSLTRLLSALLCSCLPLSCASVCRLRVQTGEYFRATDFAVGKRIQFNKHNFEIIEGDEYTLSYMKKHFSPEAEASAAAGGAPAAGAGVGADPLNTSGESLGGGAEGSPKGSASPGKGSKAGGVLASAGKQAVAHGKHKAFAPRARVTEQRAAGAAPKL